MKEDANEYIMYNSTYSILKMKRGKTKVLKGRTIVKSWGLEGIGLHVSCTVLKLGYMDGFSL